MKQLTSLGLMALTVALAPVAHAQYTADFQTNIISGVTSNWSGSYYVGSNTFADVLLIQGVGVLSIGGCSLGCESGVGYESGSSNNCVVVTGAGSVWSNSGPISVGLSGSGNRLVISNGGKVFSRAPLGAGVSGFVGYGSGSSNNTVLVSDTNSTWNNEDGLYIGSHGNGNSLVVSNGGRVVNELGRVGTASSSNSVRVADGGVWQNRTLTIGWAWGGNSLVVAGGAVFATGLIVGNSSATCDNLLQLDSGSVIVTNATTNAVLEVRRGKLMLNGGTLQVDRFVMTDACAQFVRTGGTLIYGSAVLTTNLDADGDGMANGWEQASGLDPLNAADASADNDGDGFTNLQEFQAGTNPTNASSAFRVLSLESTNDDMLVTWQAGGGRTNVVQSASDLTPLGAGQAGSYSNVSPNINVPGTGDVTTNWLDTGAGTNDSSRFYRIRLVP